MGTAAMVAQGAGAHGCGGSGGTLQWGRRTGAGQMRVRQGRQCWCRARTGEALLGLTVS